MDKETDKIPLLEYDPDPTAIIEPAEHYVKESPSPYCVMPIYPDLLDKLENEGKLKPFRHYTGHQPLFEGYTLEHKNQTVMVIFPGVGAPFAALCLEEAIAFGCRKFIACGTCGVLDSKLDRGHIIIPDKALRDEGTSYHYCKPAKFINMDKKVVAGLEAVCRKNGIGHETGTTWTTDGVYRETRGKIARRKAEGCIAVEMECSALIAVARFRGVAFGQYLEAYDDVSGAVWDTRHVDNKMEFQERVFWLSVEACLTL